MEVKNQFQIWVQVINHTDIGTKQVRKFTTRKMLASEANWLADQVRDLLIEKGRKFAETDEEKMVSDLDHVQEVNSAKR